MVVLKPTLDTDAVETFKLSDYHAEMLEAVEYCIDHGRHAGELLIGPRQKLVLRVSGLPDGLAINDSNEGRMVGGDHLTPGNRPNVAEAVPKRGVSRPFK